MNKTTTNLERIIAKIDNDFNPDNSDWIPRVGAWTIDAMSILKVTPTERKRKTINVKDRIAYLDCSIITNNLKVFDSNGCPVEEQSNADCGCSSTSTGKIKQSNTTEISDTMAMTNNKSNNGPMIASIEITKGNEPITHKILELNTINTSNENRNYTIVGTNKIELNFDTKCITIEYDGIKTIQSSIYDCELPVIPDNGILIECIVAWCMYKMLCRGYKHPVFNLRDNSPAINPYIFWMQFKDKAKDSVTSDYQGDIDSNLWRSAFYIDTFNIKDY